VSMRGFVVCVAALVVCLPVLGDGHGARIQWADWTIESGEGSTENHIHRGFPLTYLVDDDPSTAWVFSDKLDPIYRPVDYHHITIWFEKPRFVDELRIMNGYNKSEELFRRNDRVVEMTVANDRSGNAIVRRVTLTDRMGWHSVRLPRREYDCLTVVFTELVRGRDDDLCISGIELRDGGVKLPWHLPAYVLYDPGGHCSCGGDDWSIMSRTGKVRGAFGDASHSPSGRYAAGVIWGRDDRAEMRVGDLETGETVYRWRGLPLGGDWEWEVEWKDDRRVEVTCREEQSDRVRYRRVVKVRQ
jgi:hypothetical protein